MENKLTFKDAYQIVSHDDLTNLVLGIIFFVSILSIKVNAPIENTMLCTFGGLLLLMIAENVTIEVSIAHKILCRKITYNFNKNDLEYLDKIIYMNFIKYLLIALSMYYCIKNSNANILTLGVTFSVGMACWIYIIKGAIAELAQRKQIQQIRN